MKVEIIRNAGCTEYQYVRRGAAFIIDNQVETHVYQKSSDGHSCWNLTTPCSAHFSPEFKVRLVECELIARVK